MHVGGTRFLVCMEFLFIGAQRSGLANDLTMLLLLLDREGIVLEV